MTRVTTFLAAIVGAVVAAAVLVPGASAQAAGPAAAPRTGEYNCVYRALGTYRFDATNGQSYQVYGGDEFYGDNNQPVPSHFSAYMFRLKLNGYLDRGVLQIEYCEG